jgi:hypothetical protein
MLFPNPDKPEPLPRRIRKNSKWISRKEGAKCAKILFFFLRLLCFFAANILAILRKIASLTERGVHPCALRSKTLVSILLVAALGPEYEQRDQSNQNIAEIQLKVP